MLATLPGPPLKRPAIAARLGVHPDTVTEWIERGTKRGVKLRAVRIGERWVSTELWLDQFLREQNEAKAKAVVPRETKGQRRKRQEAAEAVCKKYGV